MLGRLPKLVSAHGLPRHLAPAEITVHLPRREMSSFTDPHERDIRAIALARLSVVSALGDGQAEIRQGMRVAAKDDG